MTVRLFLGFNKWYDLNFNNRGDNQSDTGSIVLWVMVGEDREGGGKNIANNLCNLWTASCIKRTTVISLFANNGNPYSLTDDIIYYISIQE